MTQPRAIRFEDLLDMRRAAHPRISPDGTMVVFSAARPDVESNRNLSHLYRVPLAGGEVVQMTRRGSNTEPAYSPEGEWIAFTSNRLDDEPSQVWMMPAGGGEARAVTRLPLGARRPVWFPDGKQLLVIAPVYPDLQDLDAMAAREKERKNAGTRPRIIDGLMYRHWDHWTDGKVDHLFAVDVETGEARDLTPGPYPVPPRSLTGDPDHAVSPDGLEICYTSLREKDQALSTGIQVWVAPAAGGEARAIGPFAGVHAFPVYSPDGTQIAFSGMRRAGYEADRLELLVYERASGTTREVAPDFDASVGPVAWSPDGKLLYFAADEKGRRRIFVVESGGGTPRAITEEATDAEPVVSPDGEWIVFVRQTMSAPPEIFALSRKGETLHPVTRLNREILAELDLPDPADFWFEGAKGARVHGMLLKPPGFETGRRYPVVFLIHGGPQSMFGLDFHERWNTQLFASRGYVVVTINPRGSTGYGQEFTDAIRGEWGGACYEDLIRGFDYVLETFSFCDPERTAAAGASFGGYMVNWINGKTDRFRCLVSHDGIMNTEMMDYATDELWFTEWEFRGAPWETPEEYLKWSPHLHVGKMKTPMLVIQGEQDFRCVVTEGTTLFTALQRRGVPSRLLYLPDEGHWVLKPKNRQVWYQTVLDWLTRYLEA